MIIQRYQNTDPYTKAKLEITNDVNIPTNFDIDHVHEAQILVLAVKHTSEFMP